MRLELVLLGRRLVVELEREEDYDEEDTVLPCVGNTEADLEIADDEERPNLYPADPDLGSFGFASRRR